MKKSKHHEFLTGKVPAQGLTNFMIFGPDSLALEISGLLQANCLRFLGSDR